MRFLLLGDILQPTTQGGQGSHNDPVLFQRQKSEDGGEKSWKNEIKKDQISGTEPLPLSRSWKQNLFLIRI